MRLSSLWAVALFFGAAPGASADPAPSERSPNGPRDLVVHEWGTFSTFSGSDGRNLEFQPYDDDLPDFVHGYLPRNSKAGPAGGSISLETPVLYFYTDRPVAAAVQVDFPKGILTEWYPHAVRTDHRLVWPDVRVAPKEDLKLPTERKPSRYYAARQTDAAPLKQTLWRDNQTITEQEKLLFYRGGGTFDMPLSVRARQDGKVTVRWAGTESVGAMILVRVQGGKVRFQPFELERQNSGVAEADVAVPDRDATAGALGDVLAKQLVGQGLFDKEARAMVETWSSAWFGEEGTRVLYFLPDKLTEGLLPLRIDPKPASLVRVLVGRHDVLTPEREQRIDVLVAELKRPTRQADAKQRAAWQELTKLGRYHGAAQQAAEARLQARR